MVAQGLSLLSSRFCSLGATLVGVPKFTEACSFLFAKAPCLRATLQVLASKYCSCGWEARLHPGTRQDLAGPLGVVCWQILCFLSQILQQQGRSEEATLGARLGR